MKKIILFSIILNVIFFNTGFASEVGTSFPGGSDNFDGPRSDLDPGIGVLGGRLDHLDLETLTTLTREEMDALMQQFAGQTNDNLRQNLANALNNFRCRRQQTAQQPQRTLACDLGSGNNTVCNLINNQNLRIESSSAASFGQAGIVAPSNYRLASGQTPAGIFQLSPANEASTNGIKDTPQLARVRASLIGGENNPALRAFAVRIGEQSGNDNGSIFLSGSNASRVFQTMNTGSTALLTNSPTLTIPNNCPTATNP